MKVLLVNTSEIAGGAAIAALRLLHALHTQGVEATLLCRDRAEGSQREGVTALSPSWWRRFKFAAERLEIYVRNGFSREGLFAVDTARLGNDITSLDEFKEADVVHLHWTNQAMLSLGNLRKILASGKRVVWTMHDMWPFTGVCHHAADCEGWLTGCGNCPQLRYPGKRDLSASTYRRKQRAYATGQITFVGCSLWLTELAARSPLLKGHRLTSIPNPIDTDFYLPAGTEGAPSKTELRKQLGLPQDKRILLFVAFKATDPNKGVNYLIESLELLCQERPELRDQMAVALAGRDAEKLRDAFAVETFALGYRSAEADMLQLYQACDLLVMPTLMDNLPNTIAEANSCGMPCVAFGVGGVPQMVETGINGYLAQPQDSQDFAHGIAQTLQSRSYDALCRNARKKAVATYSEQTVAERYLALYTGGTATEDTHSAE